MKAINYQDFRKICPEVFILLEERDIKFVDKAYGWSNDTLLVFAEETPKHLFYICKNRRGEVDYDRRFIYYIKPNTLTVIENSSVKIRMSDSRVIQFKDPYNAIMNWNKVEEVKEQLSTKISEINDIIKYFENE